MNTKYQNLQKSATFQAMPDESKFIILGKETLGEACAELRMQHEANFPATYQAIKSLEKTGKYPTGIMQIGKPKGTEFRELTQAEQELVVELDPSNFHPESIKFTPRESVKIKELFAEALK